MPMSTLAGFIDSGLDHDAVDAVTRVSQQHTTGAC